MRRAFLTVVLASLTTLAAHAQNGAAPLPAQTAAIGTFVDACPVGFTARQQGFPGAAWTISLEDTHSADSGPRDRGGVGVHVELASQKKSIDSVRLLVHYIEPGTRAIPLRQMRGDRRELTKTFDVKPQDSVSRRVAADLLVGAASGIVRVDLVRVEYVGGGVWEQVRAGACSVRPSLFVPVGAQ